jgi:Uma2 family endonuclease
MATSMLLTTEQFLALEEEFNKHGNHVKQELIRGEIVNMPPPSQRHDLIKNRIAQILFRHLDRHQPELEVLVEIAYEVSGYDTLVPDVSVVRKNRIVPKKRGLMSGAPELAIEVISATETAAHVKSKIGAYLQNGSRTVWIVYPDDQSVVVHGSDRLLELRDDQLLEDALLAGFSVSVSAFFEGA